MKKQKTKNIIFKNFFIMGFLALSTALFYVNAKPLPDTNKLSANNKLNFVIPNDETIISYYKNKNFIFLKTTSKNGVIFTRKILRNIKNTTTQKKVTTPQPTYGPYKNDPYDESDSEWDNNEYINNILHLKMSHHPSNYFKIRILSNKIDFAQQTENVSLPEKYVFYSWALFIDDKNHPSAFLEYVLNTGSLMQYLREMEDNLFYNGPLYGKDCCNMFIMDKRIKLTEPLDFPKNEWSKRQKNLNYIIYVKKDFLQKLTPEEWSEIIFYIPFRAIISM